MWADGDVPLLGYLFGILYRIYGYTFKDRAGLMGIPSRLPRIFGHPALGLGLGSCHNILIIL